MLYSVSLQQINRNKMLTKEKVLKTINDLPDTFSADEVIERIILLQKIEKGLEQSAKGQTHSTATAKKKLKKWLK